MPFKILLILGGLSAFGPLAIDLYLPAFPAMAVALATDSEHIQLSLSAYFVGLALGQLFYGPIADRFGRRKPLLFGIGLFCVASLACALAPTIEWLIAARFAQALGGCAGIVVNRAVVRDLCEPIEAAKAFSQLMLIMGVAPILAPLAGGWLLELGNWTWIFLFLTLFSAVFSFAVFFGLKETLAPSATPPALSSALGRYRRLFSEPLFMFHALTGGIAMAGMFAYIAGSPFLIIELYGIPAAHFGWFFAINASGFILFAQVNSWLLRRHPPMKLLRFTTVFFAVCNLILLGVAVYQPATLWPFLLPLFGSVAVIALVLPNSSAEAMAGQGHQAGVASALMGTMQFVIAGITSALVGLLHDGTAVPMTAVMAACGIGALVMAQLAQRTAARKKQAALAI